MREYHEPTTNERGEEEHPAFGLIGVSRESSTGTALFDSDIEHRQVVTVQLRAAVRSRDLHRDWVHARETIVEVQFSEAQWASFVSSSGLGDGVPCTIRFKDGALVPGFPIAPRLALTLEEASTAAEHAFEQIKEAMEAFDALSSKAPAAERRAALAALRTAIRNAVPNVDYASKKLVENAEAVVARSRADVEALVLARAHELGLDPASLEASGALTLDAGEPA